jgi:hypothetical protein
MEDWDDFDKILEKFKSAFLLKIMEAIDGPESRVWQIELDQFPMSLHNNPYGNYLKATEQKSIEYLRIRVDDLELMFK